MDPTPTPRSRESDDVVDRLPDRPSEEHPILAGLLALVAVGLAVGLVIGGVVIVGTKLMGLGDDSGDSASSGRASLYLPTPVKTQPADEPQVTLGSGASGSPEESASPNDPGASESAKPKITLAVSTTEVGSMEPFELTGVYPKGEGAILTVQRFEDGAWVDFPATGSVSGEQFQIPVQSSRVGKTRFRVVDSDSGLKSDEVTVTVAG
jgi:hypothetical protein